MIDRYTRPEMGQLWSKSARFEFLLEVELAVAQAQSEFGLIPKEAYSDIRGKARFDVARIEQIEQQTRHDVIAFVSNVAENVGPHGRFLHYCLTSSDALDTALSLQILEAGVLIQKELQELIQVITAQVEKHKETLCAGRTHGMHAEPTSFGLKMAGHCEELRRDSRRFSGSLAQMGIGKLSGAVGTYSALSPEVEARALEILGLKSEVIATQVIPRDRHAQVFFALSMIGCGLERLAVELRHLQRTEVAEVSEGFSKGQKGSSAMPHKRNPISAENLTGCARLLRSHLQAALENVALWHERDISHSSVERVIFPDAFILADYCLDRMKTLVQGLEVDATRMVENMELSQGKLYSSHLLLKLVERGLLREEAYALVQELSFQSSEEGLQTAALKHPKVSRLLSAQDLEEIFSGDAHRKAIRGQVERWLKNAKGEGASA